MLVNDTKFNQNIVSIVSKKNNGFYFKTLYLYKHWVKIPK